MKCGRILMRIFGSHIVAAFAIFIIFFLLLALTAPEVGGTENTGGIKDMTGRDVYISDTVKHAMIFPPVAFHYATVDETDAHISFIPRYTIEEAKNSLLGKIYPEITDKDEALTTVGAIPLGIEQILLVKPDAVLSWEWFSEELRGVKYPGLVEVTVSEDNDVSIYRLIGALTGKSGRAEYIIGRYKRKTAEIFDSMPPVTEETPVLVIGNDDFSLYNANFRSFNDTVRRLGGLNLAESLGRNYNAAVGVETLIEFDPEVIFIADYTMLMKVEDVYQNPALQNVAAVKNRRVYRFPRGIARMSGPVETPIFLVWLSCLINPGGNPETPLRKEIKDTFKEVYNYELTESDIDTMLHIEENGKSVYYNKFYRK